MDLSHSFDVTGIVAKILKAVKIFGYVDAVSFPRSTVLLIGSGKTPIKFCSEKTYHISNSALRTLSDWGLER